MAGGRPTDYSPKILKQTREYIAECVDTWQMVQKRRRDWVNIYNVKLPSIEGLAYYLNVSRDTIYQWATVHTEFSDILEQLRALQAEKLINGGLGGSYNSTIAKVLLTKHGYREGLEHTGADGDKLFDDEAAKKSKGAIASFFKRGN